MEVKPKISRYLIFVVIFIFTLLIIGIYGLLSSESLTKYVINTVISNFIPADKLKINLDQIEGSLLSGIKIYKAEIKHVKPNFEANIKNILIKPIFEKALINGVIDLTGNIGSLECVGLLKLPPVIASVPAFIGPECFVGLPKNIKIKQFDINNIKIQLSKDLEIFSDKILLSSNEKPDNINIDTELKANWKQKPLAKFLFNGILEQRKKKISGNIRINAAKQFINSELSIFNGKKGIEYSGYIASDSVIDFKPLSTWLGYFWQIDYPYALTGKLYCQGSWLYNSEVGFLGNLNGRYEKLDISFLGLFISLLELNGEWKLFDGNLSLSDSGSKLIGFPAKLKGKIESVASKNRKWNISFEANSLPLDKLTESFPWMVKYTNGIPDLDGVATLSIALLGNRPMVNANAELINLSQKNIVPITKTSGRAFYVLNETGIGTIKANFVAQSNSGMPLFFKKFPNNLYDFENKNNVETTFKYSINGHLKDKANLKGVLKLSDKKIIETSGELIEDKFNLLLSSDENRVYRVFGVDPIDLILMR